MPKACTTKQVKLISFCYLTSLTIKIAISLSGLTKLVMNWIKPGSEYRRIGAI